MDIAELDSDILETNFFLLSSRDTFPELPESFIDLVLKGPTARDNRWLKNASFICGLTQIV